MRHLLAPLARACGYDLVARHKPREPIAQLVQALRRREVGTVIDVGANRGQYASALRAHGWGGPIVSIEPLAELHAALDTARTGDARWTVLPPMALGARDGTALIEVAAESDMSSLRPQGALLQHLSPSSRVIERRDVTLRRLDGLAELQPAGPRLFLKLDVQGAEADVLEGAHGLWPRIVGLQVEMALVPLYEGETDWRTMLDHLASRGFTLHLFVPGYFEPKLARQVQVDGIFFKDSEPLAGDAS